MNDLFVGHFFYPTPIIYSSLYKCTWFTGFNWFLTNLSVRRRLSQRRRKYKNKRTFSACRIAEEILIFSIIIYSLCFYGETFDSGDFSETFSKSDFNDFGAWVMPHDSGIFRKLSDFNTLFTFAKFIIFPSI